MDVTVDNIKYRSSGDGCPFFGMPSTGSDAFLTQTVTIEGYSNAAHTNQVGISVS